MKKNPYETRIHRNPGVTNLKKEITFDRETLAEVWSAAEALASPGLDSRQYGLDRLQELDVIRRSPLVAYLLGSRLQEPDVHLRSRIVRLLAGLLDPDPDDPPVAGAVQSILHAYLSQMRTRQIFALLQVADYDPEAAEEVAALLKACSFAGNQLAELITDHEIPVPIRRQAVQFTSQIGFLVAVPSLERLVRRIESRYSPQETFPGMGFGEENEASLLPYMKEALASLKAV